ncbi:MAG: PAS domain S-box protein [Deltaproteobacteria bacterium]|nr:PAS domain S-box protein [Deltaproteobacteria bacterium]
MSHTDTPITEYTRDEKIFAEKVEQLYSNAPIGLVATLINAFILAFILEGMSPALPVIPWLATLLGIFVFRASFIYRYRRSSRIPMEARYWNNWFNVNMAFSGIIWGSAGVFLFPTESIAHQVFLAFVLGGMVAGMAGTFAVNLMTFFCFTFPAFLPVILRFFFIWDDIHIAMGTMSTLFFVLMFFSAKRVTESHHLSLTLKFENEDLVRHLQQAKDRAESYNEELRQEIEERQRIEEELKDHKNNLENLVHERTNELSDVNIELEKEIAERIEVQKALRESEEKYRLLVDNANDAIIIIQDEVIKFANQATFNISGYTKDELIEKPFILFIHEEDLEGITKRYFNRMNGLSVPQVYSLRIHTKFGDELWAQNNAVLINWEGRPATLNFLRDITLLRQLENQLHHKNKMEAIGTLAGGIAHDFNNLLSIILGNVELALLDMTQDHSGRQYILQAQKAVLRSKDIVNQILSFSRKGASEKLPINIRSVVEEALGLLRVSLPASIQIETAIHTDETVLADSTQVHQLIMNLCANAAHAMNDEGKIRIELRKMELKADAVAKYPDMGEGDYICLRVKDTGRGMDHNTMERIFEPYFTTKALGKGTGMGLTQCYAIVKNHNGIIRVDSMVGKGAVFEILLPCYAGAAISESASPDKIFKGMGERILFVDDEDEVVNVGREMLDRLGYSPITKTDPEKALMLFQQDPGSFDLVITDLTMPGMSGVRLAEKIRTIRPEIPMIISSGFSDLINKLDLQQMKPAAFLRKPYTMAKLSKAIHKVMRRE